MITLANADKVLKDVYLGAVCEEMNKRSNPFYAAIKKGSETIDGKRAVIPVRCGINGGISSANEAGLLPKSAINTWQQFNIDLANIYGVIQITDKAIRASQNSDGAAVNLLNYQIETLLESAKFNFNRMLWQDGSGELARVRTSSNIATVEVDKTVNFREGMLIDIINGVNFLPKRLAWRVLTVNREAKTITVEATEAATLTIAENDIIVTQGSYNNEILGLPYIFDNSLASLYGVNRNSASHILSSEINLNGALTTDAMQQAVDLIEEKVNDGPNMILTSFDVRRKYLAHLQQTRTNIDFLNLDGGFKAISYSGIPVVADRFCGENAMFFVNTDDFKLIELCDWQWIEGDNGSILTKVSDRAAYSATLVKYANLGCVRPYAQTKLSNII
jgi:hypothetical protein